MVMTRMARFGLTVENFDNETSLFKSLQWICAQYSSKESTKSTSFLFSPVVGVHQFGGRLWGSRFLGADI